MQVVSKYGNPKIFQVEPNVKIKTGPGFWGLQY
jgi:hypothetical protein